MEGFHISTFSIKPTKDLLAWAYDTEVQYRFALASKLYVSKCENQNAHDNLSLVIKKQ